jgi:integrase/recombinase XerD
MADEAMSSLRRRMIEDMTIRKLAPNTPQDYIRTIKDFAAFLGRSPEPASLGEYYNENKGSLSRRIDIYC